MTNKQKEILTEAKAILVGRWITDLANIAALLFEKIEEINWVGFYLIDKSDPKQTLWLGPFQGRVACTEIKMGKGVCGTAAFEKKTVIVANVHEFPGHIVCDPRSQSEIVIPLQKNGKIVGVLDVDSAKLGRFTPDDQAFFEAIAKILC